MNFKNYSKKSSTYYHVRDWLEGFIPLVWGKEELGLVRIKYLLKLLGNPQTKFKSIHVAGTSGKGSTAFYIAQLLRNCKLETRNSKHEMVRFTHHPEQSRRTDSNFQNSKSKDSDFGFRISDFNRQKVGLHISPHLVDIRERMQIFQVQSSKFKVQSYNRLMPMGRFLRLFKQVRPVVEKIQKTKPELTPSYFEILVAAAFKYFAEEKVDFALVEVGLGGRLDATNVLKPEVSVITNIGLDHTEILGDTVEKIAFEKAGIVKPNTPIITGAKGVSLRVIKRVASERNAFLVSIQSSKFKIQNLELAVRVVEELGFRMSNQQLKQVSKLKFPGRFEKIDDHVILDGAHNPDKIRFLIQGVKKLLTTDKLQLTKKKKSDVSGQMSVVVVIAFKKGKDWKKMIDLLVKRLPVRQIIATEFQAVTDTGMFAAVDPEEICDYVAKVYGVECIVISNSLEAVFYSLSTIHLSTNSLVLVTGSLYLVGEVRTMWELPFDFAQDL